MESNSIPLTDMVKRLGYKNHTKLANKIANILKDKEDFEEKFIVDDREIKHGRVEKTMVSSKAETLVDNLVILSQYTYLFGRDSSRYAPYKELQKGIQEKPFKLKVQNKSRSLQEDIKRSQSSLKDLPIFASAILKSKCVDITKQSLRELMQEEVGNKEIMDFQDTLELTNWNEIVELKEQINVEGDDSVLYQKLAEKLYELGDFEQSLMALDRSIELNINNGISWAIKSLILYSQLNATKKSHLQALVRTDYSGEISNPITSEERWINERVDDTYYDLTSIRSMFLTSALYALINWPDWGFAHTYGEAKGKPNYYYKLSMDYDTEVEVERSFLFLKLLNELNNEFFSDNREKIIEVLRSFQHWDKDMNPNTTLFYDLNNTDKANIFTILSLISDDDIKNGLTKYFQTDQVSEYRAKDDLELLKINNVCYLYRKFIGKAEYNKHLRQLLDLEIKNQEIANLNQIAATHYIEVSTPLNRLKKKFKVDFQFGNEPPEFWKNGADLTEKEIENILLQALTLSSGWQEHLFSQAWTKSPYSVYIHKYFYSLILTSILLEVLHLKNIDNNIKYLNEIFENERALRDALSEVPSYFYCSIVERIDTDKLPDNQRNELLSTLEIIYDLRQVIDDEEAEENYYYD